MTGTLAQIIAITSFGNEYLKSGNLINFYPQNSTFQHCDFVDFRELNNEKEFIIAKNPIEWFKDLKSKKCLKIRLFHQSVKQDDYRYAGFTGGGGDWFIETIFSNYSDLWKSRWDYDKKKDKKPWQVTYGKVYENQSIINQQLDISQTRERLKICLEKITEFAFQETTENWGNIFEKAYNTLSSKKPKSDFYHTDLMYWENYDLQNQQLLMSASKAFVFGGMGSWNDVWFEKKEIYDIHNKLSTELYQTMIQSIVCAINRDKIECASA